MTIKHRLKIKPPTSPTELKDVVNFFTDCAYINNIKKPYKIDKQKCCKTTFWGGARIEKQLVSWDHSVCDKICYEFE